MKEKLYYLVEANEKNAMHAGVDAQNKAALSTQEKPIVLVFSDDSTLFFALNLRRALQKETPQAVIELAWYLPENALSFRQIEQQLGNEKPARVLDANGLKELLKDPNVRAVATSRVFAPIRDTLRDLQTRLKQDRPCLVSFLGGLDFFPMNGLARRRFCDVVYAFPKHYLDLYETATSAEAITTWQSLRFGHPTALFPKAAPEDLPERQDIYFFAQALSPKTKSSRQHIVDCLCAMARRYPQKRFWIKLRHLKSENTAHLHIEKYDFQTLLEETANVPENLKVTACRMDEALADAALGITCTSTAALDTLSAGIPCMVLLDFPDAAVDGLVAPMRELFEESGLIVSQNDLLNLNIPTPNPQWLADTLCPEDLGEDFFAALEEYENRTFKWQV